VGPADGGALAVLEWGVASQRLAGEAYSGDLHLVQPFPNGTLVAVVDGLGHGEEAAAAASGAIAILDAHPEAPLTMLVKRCDDALKGTRGVVMSLAAIDPRRRQMEWLGVGNVEGVLLGTPRNGTRSRQSLLLRGGVVGSRLPAVRTATLPIESGDLLVFATDGVRTEFADEITFDAEPQHLADRLLARYAKGTDDALVLVARVGAGP
jgi:serine phosphatase RsbU (regulator of sigma subunit)